MCASVSLPNLAKLFSVHMLLTYVILRAFSGGKCLCACEVVWSPARHMMPELILHVSAYVFFPVSCSRKRCCRSFSSLSFLFFRHSYFVLFDAVHRKNKAYFLITVEMTVHMKVFTRTVFFFSSHSFLPTWFNSKYEHYMWTTKPIKFI